VHQPFARGKAGSPMEMLAEPSSVEAKQPLAERKATDGEVSAPSACGAGLVFPCMRFRGWRRLLAEAPAGQHAKLEVRFGQSAGALAGQFVSGAAGLVEQVPGPGSVLLDTLAGGEHVAKPVHCFGMVVERGLLVP